MNARLWLLSILFCGVGPWLLSADEKADNKRVVGSVLGKEVTAADIDLKEPIDVSVKFDAKDEARWELMSRISQKFGQPILDRFVKEQKIEATAEELAKFKANSKKQNERQLRDTEKELKAIERKLIEDPLSAEERMELGKKKALYERIRESMEEAAKREAPDEIARTFIQAWKVEQKLHAEFGGRVIFQQFGPEALDGRRRLYEKAEKDGDLKFKDDSVRHMFYYYSNMRHTDVGEDTFKKQPWFLAD